MMPRRLDGYAADLMEVARVLDAIAVDSGTDGRVT